MFERLQRSWDLAIECLRVLREDKRLLVFPLFSVIAMLLIVGSFAVPLLPLARTLFARSGRPPDHLTAAGARSGAPGRTMICERSGPTETYDTGTPVRASIIAT